VAQVSTGVWKFRSSFLAQIVENPVIGFDDRIFHNLGLRARLDALGEFGWRRGENRA
jgi:hypothetical protein